MNSIKKTQQYIHKCLNDLTYKGTRIINFLLIILIILSIIIIPLHFIDLPTEQKQALILFEKFVVTIFIIEYFLRIWTTNKPFHYIFSWFGLIDLAAITPSFINLFTQIDHPETFLLLRLLRLLKLVKIYEINNRTKNSCKIKSIKKHGNFNALEGEYVENIIQKHPVIFLLGMILPTIFCMTGLVILVFFQDNSWGIAIAILFFAFSSIFFLKAWLDMNYDVIYITNRRVILQNRELFGTITNDISYPSITNIRPNSTGLIQWALGFGHVEIDTAATEGTLTFHNAPTPHEVVQHISQNRQKTLDELKEIPLTIKKN
jgi:hypothetical protein